MGFNQIAMPVEKAAQKVVRAIQKKRFKVIFCVESVVFDFTRRFSAVGVLNIMRLFQKLKK